MRPNIHPMKLRTHHIGFTNANTKNPTPLYHGDNFSATGPCISGNTTRSIGQFKVNLHNEQIYGTNMYARRNITIDVLKLFSSLLVRGNFLFLFLGSFSRINTLLCGNLTRSCGSTVIYSRGKILKCFAGSRGTFLFDGFQPFSLYLRSCSSSSLLDVLKPQCPYWLQGEIYPHINMITPMSNKVEQSRTKLNLHPGFDVRIFDGDASSVSPLRLRCRVFRSKSGWAGISRNKNRVEPCLVIDNLRVSVLNEVAFVGATKQKQQFIQGQYFCGQNRTLNISLRTLNFEHLTLVT